MTQILCKMKLKLFLVLFKAFLKHLLCLALSTMTLGRLLQWSGFIFGKLKLTGNGTGLSVKILASAWLIAYLKTKFSRLKLQGKALI